MAEKKGECSSKTFSAKNMSELFQKCAKADNAEQVDMDCYLAAWDELIKLVNISNCK